MFHIISDLQLSYVDPALDQLALEKIPEYIIITGNICYHNKRSMLYAETLANKYQNSKVIFNHGIKELDKAEYYKIQDGFRLRITDLKRSPPNLYYPKGECIGEYDFYCTLGWPIFSNKEDFLKFTNLTNIIADWNEQFYIDGVLMTDNYHRYLSAEEVNRLADKEKEELKAWLSTDSSKQKILISGTGNKSNDIIGNNFTVFEGLDLSNVIWICGGSDDFIGINNNHRIISLPGRDRSRYISDNFKLLE